MYSASGLKKQRSPLRKWAFRKSTKISAERRNYPAQRKAKIAVGSA